VQVLGIFMTSLATEYWQLFLAQGVCVGIADGILVCPCLAVVTTYFSKSRAMAMALVLTGSATGGITFPLVAQALLPRIGFPWTMRVIGFIALTTSAVASSFMKARLPPRKLGPIVDWRAFRELPYTLFSISMLLVFMGLYFAFYYVRCLSHLQQSIKKLTHGLSRAAPSGRPS
jgi:MFS family permease